MESLNLTWCIGLTDQGIVDSMQHFKRGLKLLSMFGLVVMTDKAFEAILSSPSRDTLETFDINGCKLITKNSDEEIR